MQYLTNHYSCHESNWNNATFYGEALVCFDQFEETYTISGFLNKIVNPDFEKITIKKSIFDEELYKDKLEFAEEMASEKNKELSDEYKNLLRDNCIKLIPTLNNETIKWLNENIPDQKFSDENDTLENKKAWAIGSDKYLLKDRKISIFFARQSDALRFIKEFSIFKTPTLYFDYFHDDHREMKLEDIIDIINKNSNINLNINDIVIKIRENISNNMSPYTFRLFDWEQGNTIEENESFDDCELNQVAVNEIVEKIYPEINIIENNGIDF